MNDPRYPIGRFEPLGRPLTTEERASRVADIEGHPARVRALVSSRSDGDLDAPYRDGGWTHRQLVHHLLDSHVNACTRFRLALTEDHPTIRPYDQDAWAELPDAKTGPIEPSLDALDGVHARWATLLGAMAPEQFGRTLRHPEIGDVTLDFMLDLYAWHTRHHEAHLAADPRHPRVA